MACEPCACRSQCGEIGALTPALAAVRFTIPCTARGEPASFAACEHGIIGVTAQREQQSADDLRQEHLARLLTLAQDRDLHQVVLAGPHIRPRQADDHTDAQPAGMRNLNLDAVALGGRGTDQ